LLFLDVTDLLKNYAGLNSLKPLKFLFANVVKIDTTMNLAAVLDRKQFV